ncbi:MAG: nucleotidyltransferase family protein [Desulfobulbaceae bacterium]|jgi:hypothetical protein|nr:nucleotidyltransferase family protein [Desulfobulbaceae bacterium]
MFPPISSHIYARERLALAPVVRADWPGQDFIVDLDKADRDEQQEFSAYIISQGMTGHWLSHATGQAAWDDSHFFTLLRQRQQLEVMRYLAQRRALDIIERRFTAHDIPYAVMKGAHTRELLYANPAIRPSVDIDVLIAPEHRFKAVETLAAAGFTLRINPATISHEVSLNDTLAGIDLHWDILRPGRALRNLACEMLERRARLRDFFALRAEDELFLLLFHPVFTKYLTTPHARLANIADLFRWGKTMPINWTELCRLCARHHFTTAAWLVTSHMKVLTDSQDFDDFIAVMRPKAVKAAWLGYWLRENYSSRFLDRPWLIQAFFTLPAHDRWRDALRFLGVWQGGQRAINEERRLLSRAAEVGGQ